MKHYCNVCHSIHDGRCRAPRYAERKRNSEADRFRNTQVWRKTAKRIIRRDLNCCRVCLSGGVVEYRELSVHHIVPIACDYDRRLDDDNLITLCRYHHEKAEQGQISRKKLLEIVQKPAVLPQL